MDFNTQTNSPHASIKAETLFTFGPIHFTNSMLMTLIVIAVLVIFFVVGTRKMSLIPGRLQGFVESIVEILLGLIEGTAGKRTGRVIFPLIATLFIFILTANWMSLLPGVGSITCPSCTVHEQTASPTDESVTPGGETHEGEAGAAEEAEHEPDVPWLRAPNADLNTTIALALISVIVVQSAAVISHGVGGYLKELSTPLFLTPVHVIGELSRILSLAARLFGNIFGGEVLLAVMYYLFSLVFVGFLNAIFVGLELFFGLIQALLFAILTLNYIAVAVGSHKDDHGDSHTEPHAAETIDSSNESGTARHMA